MDEAVRTLAADSGVLQRIVGNRTDSGYILLDLVFEHGTLRLSCDADTDEVLISVATVAATDAVEIDGDDDLVSLIGLVIEQAWTMTNDRGYADAFQLRCLNSESRRESCCQFEVAAAAIAVHRVAV